MRVKDILCKFLLVCSKCNIHVHTRSWAFINIRLDWPFLFSNTIKPRGAQDYIRLAVVLLLLCIEEYRGSSSFPLRLSFVPPPSRYKHTTVSSQSPHVQAWSFSISSTHTRSTFLLALDGLHQNCLTNMADPPDHSMTAPDEWLPRPSKPNQGYGLPDLTTLAGIRIDNVSRALHSSVEFDDWYWEVIGALRRHNLETLIEVETPRPVMTRPLSPESRLWVRASILVGKWLRDQISAGLMQRLREFQRPMSLADEVMILIWGYMDFNQVSIDFAIINRFENLKLSDYPRPSQYVEAFSQSYLRLQRRCIAPQPYFVVLRLLNQIGHLYPALKEAAIREMERERMCVTSFSASQFWRTVKFMILQLRMDEAGASGSQSGPEGH